MKAIILDRDGVINQDSDAYIKSAEEWLPLPGSLEAIADLTQCGYHIFVATNQSGIGRGYFDHPTLAAMHDKMHRALAPLGGKIQAVYYCPHTPENDCHCRKPRPGLIEQILQDYDLIPQETWVVGDSWRDLAAGMACQCPVALVKTGKGTRTLTEKAESMGNIPVFKDLSSFVAQFLPTSFLPNVS